jgi:hypothetical protein
MLADELHGGETGWLIGISAEYAAGYLTGDRRSGGGSGSGSRLLCEEGWGKDEKYTGKHAHGTPL